MGHLRVDRLTGQSAPLLAPDGRVLAARCHRAATPLARMAGLLFTADLQVEEALWIEPCSSVHAFGLRCAIGCAFLDGDGRVLRIVDPLPRWRAAGARGARVVVECRAGVLAAVAPGDHLRRG